MEEGKTVANVRRKTRIRKSAPTVRQQAEAAQAKAASPKPKRVKRAAGKVVSPVKKLKLPRNRATKPVYAVGRFMSKILRWLVPSYFINSWREVKLVSWPSRKETWRLTGAVFVFATVFAVLVAGVDKILDALFKSFVLK